MGHEGAQPRPAVVRGSRAVIEVTAAQRLATAAALLRTRPDLGVRLVSRRSRRDAVLLYAASHLFTRIRPCVPSQT